MRLCSYNCMAAAGRSVTTLHRLSTHQLVSRTRPGKSIGLPGCSLDDSQGHQSGDSCQAASVRSGTWDAEMEHLCISPSACKTNLSSSTAALSQAVIMRTQPCQADCSGWRSHADSSVFVLPAAEGLLCWYQLPAGTAQRQPRYSGLPRSRPLAANCAVMSQHLLDGRSWSASGAHAGRAARCASPAASLSDPGPPVQLTGKPGVCCSTDHSNRMGFLARGANSESECPSALSAAR